MVTDIEQLITDARTYAIERNAADPTERINAAIATASRAEHGHLLVARALARQNSDPGGGADDAAEAGQHFLAEGLMSYAASASAVAAGLAERAGHLAEAVNHAIDATIRLADLGDDDEPAARAYVALSNFYGHLSALDLAVEFGRRAFRAAASLDGLSTELAALSLGYFGIEAAHAARADDETRANWLAEADTAARWIIAEATSDLSREVFGPGLLAEVALYQGRVADAAAQVARAMPHIERLGADTRAWFDLVRGTLAHRLGDLDDAARALDDAIPALVADANNHCLVRALKERSAVREALGNLEGALEDARTRADLGRAWQISQTERLGRLVANQAELERDGTMLRQQAGELVRVVAEDPLTGLWSRRWLERRLNSLSGLPGTGAVVIIDLDRFKRVNDTHGHPAGDGVLAKVGGVLKGTFRDGDVARYGGEEFVVILQTDLPTAIGVAERARTAVSAIDFPDIDADLRLTISAGVAVGPLTMIRDVMKAADEALYAAKDLGRNRVVGQPTTAG